MSTTEPGSELISQPTPTPTITPTATNKPCIKPPRISFDNGSKTSLTGTECCCPDSIILKCEHLHPGKKYTAKIVSMGPAKSRIFPNSISFVASQRTQELEFFSQFVCDDNNIRPLKNAAYILQINNANNLDMSRLDIGLLDVKYGNTTIGSNKYNLFIDTNSRKIFVEFDNALIPSSTNPITFMLSIDGDGIVVLPRNIILDTVGIVQESIALS